MDTKQADLASYKIYKPKNKGSKSGACSNAIK